jgi:hypothetical protein
MPHVELLTASLQSFVVTHSSARRRTTHDVPLSTDLKPVMHWHVVGDVGDAVGKHTLSATTDEQSAFDVQLSPMCRAMHRVLSKLE